MFLTSRLTIFTINGLVNKVVLHRVLRIPRRPTDFIRFCPALAFLVLATLDGIEGNLLYLKADRKSRNAHVPLFSPPTLFRSPCKAVVFQVFAVISTEEYRIYSPPVTDSLLDYTTSHQTHSIRTLICHTPPSLCFSDV